MVISTPCLTLPLDTNFGNHQFKRLPEEPLFLRVYSTSLFKTLWETEKLLITSHFSFYHGVVYHFGELTIFVKSKIAVCNLEESKYLSFGKGLTVYQTTKILPCQNSKQLKTTTSPGLKWRFFWGGKKRKCW